MSDFYVRFNGKAVPNARTVIMKGEYLGDFDDVTKNVYEGLTNSGTPVRSAVLLGFAQNVVVAQADAYQEDPEGCAKAVRPRMRIVLNPNHYAVSSKTRETFIKGMKVIVDDNRILSHQTEGTLRGFSKNASGTILAHIDWMDGLPPLVISASKIKKAGPRKVWMVQHKPTRRGPNYRSRNILNEFYGSERDAVSNAEHRSKSDGKDYIILEATLSSDKFGSISDI